MGMKRVKVLVFSLLFVMVFSNVVLATEGDNNEENTTKAEVTSQKEETNTVQNKTTSSEKTSEEKNDNTSSTNTITNLVKETTSNKTNKTNKTTNETKATNASTNTTKNTKNSQTNNVVEEKIVETKLELKSLKIYGIDSNDEKEEIKFSPEFNKEVFEYKAEVENEIKKVEIEKDSGKIEATIEGSTELKDGENKIEIVLKDNKESVKYTISINRKEKIKEAKNAVLITRKVQKERSKIGLIFAMVVLMFLVVVLIMRVIKNRR